ncbi:MAG TPA: GrpB family protein [Paucimonas sp.]|nr:GrpB family protein [Paucimonas sp.]
MRIIIAPYRPEWAQAFLDLGRAIRETAGELALRIDHIGSTSVPGLAAKDIIDIQVTARALTPALAQALTAIGYRHMEHITGDHVPPGADGAPEDWTKWLFKIESEACRVNLHVRRTGAANQKYALLFRDYLRAHPHAAAAYAQVKTALARLHPDDADAYYDVKDPVCDLIMAGAAHWAAASGWEPGRTDC